MTALLLRLQGIMPGLPQEKGEDWAFSPFLQDQPISFFQTTAKKHLILQMEYSVLSTQLAADLKRTDACPEALMEQIACALMLTELLEYLYRHYLMVPREVERLRKDKYFYRRLLTYESATTNQDNEKVEVDVITQRIRTATAQFNWQRLFFGRSKRLALALSPLLTDLKYYADIINAIDKWTSPVLAQFSWIFFLLRLITILCIVFLHLYPGYWMGIDERNLGWVVRLQVSLQRHWFELSNDSVWAVSGLLNCFVLTGMLTPVAGYITVILFAFDIGLAALRAYIELSDLYALQREYRNLAVSMRADGASEADLDQILGFQRHLQTRIRFEQKRLGLTIINATALFVGMVLAMPVLAFNPAMPLVAAIILVSTMLIIYYLSEKLEKQRPFDKVAQLEKPSQQATVLARVGFFNQEQPEVAANLKEGDALSPETVLI